MVFAKPSKNITHILKMIFANHRHFDILKAILQNRLLNVNSIYKIVTAINTMTFFYNRS